MANKFASVELKSLKSLMDENSTEEKRNASQDAVTLALKHAKLQSQLANALAAKVQAEAELNKVLISNTDASSTAEVDAMAKYQKTLDTYDSLAYMMERLFPNGSQSSTAK